MPDTSDTTHSESNFTNQGDMMTAQHVTDIPTGIAYEVPDALPERIRSVGGVDWPADPARSVLLVHDMQDHFVDKYQRDAEPMSSVIRGIQKLVATARAAGVPVVFSAQPGDQDPVERALLTDFWGTGPRTSATGLIPELGEAGDIADSERMCKWRYSAFQRTDLHQRLAESDRDTLVITGVYANIGIKATALEAFMTDIRSVVVADAVADFTVDEHWAGVEWVARRCGAVAGLDEVLDRWGRAEVGDSAADVSRETIGMPQSLRQ